MYVQQNVSLLDITNWTSIWNTNGIPMPIYPSFIHVSSVLNFHENMFWFFNTCPLICMYNIYINHKQSVLSLDETLLSWLQLSNWLKISYWIQLELLKCLHSNSPKLRHIVQYNGGTYLWVPVKTRMKTFQYVCIATIRNTKINGTLASYCLGSSVCAKPVTKLSRFNQIRGSQSIHSLCWSLRIQIKRRKDKRSRCPPKLFECI